MYCGNRNCYEGPQRRRFGGSGCRERSGEKNKMKTALENYPELLQELKSLLTRAQYQAYKAVDNLRVQTYWQVGERIAREELKHKERADYGVHLLENLARDLGFSRRVMYEIVQFYRVYPIVQTVSAQLGWSHITELLRS